MGRANKDYQCWFCKRLFRPEELGRVRDEMSRSRTDQAVVRVVCGPCYTAIQDYYFTVVQRVPPMLHGF